MAAKQMHAVEDDSSVCTRALYVLVWRVATRTAHNQCVRLAAAGLAVGHDGAIVAGQDAVDHQPAILKHVLLACALAC